MYRQVLIIEKEVFNIIDKGLKQKEMAQIHERSQSEKEVSNRVKDVNIENGLKQTKRYQT